MRYVTKRSVAIYLEFMDGSKLSFFVHLYIV